MADAGLTGGLVVRIRNLSVGVKGTARRIIVAEEVVLRRGDRVAIIGPSGSGKTVFALALLGLIEHMAPELWLRAEIDWARPPNSRGFGVGYVPQGTSGYLNPYLPAGRQVIENAFAVRGHGANRATLEREARELFEQLGLTPADAFLAAYPHQLSGGMNQRVALAMALMVEPKLLVLDEPGTALDALQRRIIYKLVKDVAGRCCSAVLMLTHDRAEAQELATEFIEIGAGMLSARKRAGTFARGESGASAPGASMRCGTPHEFSAAAAPAQDATAGQVGLGGPVLAVKGLEATPGPDARDGTVIPFRLRGIEFSLFKGECLGVFGASGSGKTTLIRVLSGLIRPARGTVEILGRDINKLAPRALRSHRAKFQVCFQSSDQSLNPFKPVRELLDEPAQIHGFPAPTPAEIERFLELCQLPRSVLDAFPGQLSYGQRQRVALGRLLFFFPTVELFLLDEPLAGLDAAIRERMKAALAQSISGRACVIASHDHSLLDALATRLVRLHQGEIVDQARTRPWAWRSAETAAFWEAGLQVGGNQDA